MIETINFIYDGKLKDYKEGKNINKKEIIKSTCDWICLVDFDD